MTLTTEQLSAVETTKEFRALLKYMRAIAKAEPKSVKEKFELEEGLWRYASQKTIKAIVGHIDALEFALAANREAQPVSEPDYIRLDCGCCGFETLNDYDFHDGSVCPKCNHRPLGKTELYTAPPAPAVPEEATTKNVERLAHSHLDTYQLDEDEANLAADIWNACRAAMLAAAPEGGNG